MTIAVLNISVTFAPKLMKIVDNISHLHSHRQVGQRNFNNLCVWRVGLAERGDLSRDINVGECGGWYTPQTYVSVHLQMSAVGLKI